MNKAIFSLHFVGPSSCLLLYFTCVVYINVSRVCKITVDTWNNSHVTWGDSSHVEEQPPIQHSRHVK